MDTRKMLCLSTAHVSEATAKMLNDTPYTLWPVVGGPWAYGWLMYAHDERLDSGDKHFPDDLWECCVFARSKGFDYILFDQDADIADGLTFYSW
jgi:hypothetical protein